MGRISAVFPYFNQRAQLACMLPALAAQTRQPDEIVVIDDGSTDGGVELLERFAAADPRVVLLKNDQNRGVMDSLRRAMDRATGDYLAFPSAKVTLAPTLYAEMHELMERHPAAGIGFAGTWIVDAATGHRYALNYSTFAAPCFLSPEEVVSASRARLLILGSQNQTALFRRTAFDQAGGFDPDLKWNCDAFLAVLLGHRHGLCLLPRPMAVFPLLGGSYSERGSNDWSQQRGVLEAICRRLLAPECDDVRPRILRSGALAEFTLMDRLLLRERAFPALVSRQFRKRVLLKHLGPRLWKFVPDFVHRAYTNLRMRLFQARFAAQA